MELGRGLDPPSRPDPAGSRRLRGITAGVILSTSERVTERFEKARTDLEAEFRIPVRVLLREELVRLFLANLPRLAAVAE